MLQIGCETISLPWNSGLESKCVLPLTGSCIPSASPADPINFVTFRDIYPYMPTQTPVERLKWSSAITRLTILGTNIWTPLSDLVTTTPRLVMSFMTPNVQMRSGIIKQQYQALFNSNLFLAYRFASAYTDGSHYFVLLIITDGVITDMQQTKAAIVAVSPPHLTIWVKLSFDMANYGVSEIPAEKCYVVLTLKLPGPYVGMGGSLTVTAA